MARFDGEREMLTNLPPAAPACPAASRAESARVAPTRVTRPVRLGCEQAIGVDVVADSTDPPRGRVAEAREVPRDEEGGHGTPLDIPTGSRRFLAPRRPTARTQRSTRPSVR